MKWLAWMSLMSATAAPGMALGPDNANPLDFCAGAKPVVWSLRAGSYSGRQSEAPVSPGNSLSQEIAGSKPVLWSLRGGKESQGQAGPASPTPPYACWATKPVIWSLYGGHC
jgi:hypothetical protein